MLDVLLRVGNLLKWCKRREPWNSIRIVLSAILAGSSWSKALQTHDRTFLLYALSLTVVCLINAGEPPSFTEEWWRKHGFIP